MPALSVILARAGAGAADRPILACTVESTKKQCNVQPWAARNDGQEKLAGSRQPRWDETAGGF
jgi:hypothetical protein